MSHRPLPPPLSLPLSLPPSLPRSLPLALALLAACHSPDPAPPPTAPSSPAIAAACTAPAHRQFDFWHGDWDVIVRARNAPTSEEWTEARGTNRVTSSLGGCVTEEHFAAAGPGPAWAGRSVSQLVATDGKWHQTWVDDQGSYMLFVGEWKSGEMILDGEPRTKDGVTTRMRMVFHDIAPTHLQWRWEATKDDGATWRPMMTIAYAKRAR